MEHRDAERLIRLVERGARALEGIERNTAKLAAAAETYTAVFTDERASIEAQETGPEPQIGTIGHVNISWTKNPELRGRQVIIKSIDREAGTEGNETTYNIELVEKPGMIWTVPSFVFIPEHG
jgi:hypothetical protein